MRKVNKKNEILTEKDIHNEMIKELFYKMSTEEDFNLADNAPSIATSEYYQFHSIEKFKRKLKFNKETDILIVSVELNKDSNPNQYATLCK